MDLCKRKDTVASFAMAMVLGLSIVVHIIPMYLGWSYKGSILDVAFQRCCLFPFMCMGYYFLGKIWHDDLLDGINKSIAVLIFVFYIVGYFFWWLNWGWSEYFLKIIIHFFGIMLPYFCVGIYSGIYGGEKYIFRFLERMSLLVLPIVLVYISGLVISGNEFTYIDINHRNLGQYNYLVFARFCQLFLIAHLIAVCCDYENILMVTVVRWGAIAAYSLAVILSGARGPYLCVIIVLLCLMLFSYVNKKSIETIIALVLTLLLLITGGICAKSSMSSRMNVVQQGLSQGKFVTSNTASTWTREERWKTAVEEFENNPGIGLGVGGFFYKYGYTYPHSIFFDLLSDTGLLGILFWGCVFLYLLRNMLFAVFKGIRLNGIMILFLSILINANLTGYIWREEDFLIVVGFLLGVSSRKVMLD